LFVTLDERVKVVDFGAAATMPAKDASSIFEGSIAESPAPEIGPQTAATGTTGTDPNPATRIAAGTPAYASPQVLSGETPEPRDDVFSYGCVAYELLTGQHPFERQSSLQARDQGITPPRAWNLSAQQWLALLSALSWERA